MVKIRKINLKKVDLTIALAIIVALLAIITLLMPSRDKIKEIEVKKVEVKKEEMVEKYSSDLELINIYFSNDKVYYEFNDKDLSEAFLNALQMTTQEITGMEEISLL